MSLSKTSKQYGDGEDGRKELGYIYADREKSSNLIALLVFPEIIRLLLRFVRLHDRKGRKAASNSSFQANSMARRE
jgi:hypothetical protein